MKKISSLTNFSRCTKQRSERKLRNEGMKIPETDGCDHKSNCKSGFAYQLQSLSKSLSWLKFYTG